MMVMVTMMMVMVMLMIMMWNKLGEIQFHLLAADMPPRPTALCTPLHQLIHGHPFIPTKVSPFIQKHERVLNSPHVVVCTKNKKQLEKNLLVLWKKFHSNQLVGFSSENALWGLSCSPCNSLNLSCICIGQSNQLQF